MQTIRGRLTAWYSAALPLPLAAFAAVLYLDRRSASYQDLDQRMRSEASLTAGILAESYRARGVLVRPDTANRPVLIPDVAALLEAVPDILIVTAGDGRCVSRTGRASSCASTGRRAHDAPEEAAREARGARARLPGRHRRPRRRTARRPGLPRAARREALLRLRQRSEE